METHTRSIIKTLSWRFIATFITALIALAITGELRVAAEIGLLDTLIKLGAYYGHERIWLRIGIGMPKGPPPEYHI